MIQNVVFLVKVLVKVFDTLEKKQAQKALFTNSEVKRFL